MEITRQPSVNSANEGEARWGVDGSLSTVKYSAATNGGPFSIVEEVSRASDGIPLHRHPDDDEAFYVLDGEMTFYFDEGHTITVSPGAVVHIPAGAPHAFRVDSRTARYLIITTAQHEQFYGAITEPAARRTLPEPAEIDMDKVEAACQAFNVEILGPPPGMSES